jgi:protocatechuate 3,4-dioxygenase beta subunit
MTIQSNSRREFIKRISIVGVGLPALSLAATALGGWSLAHFLQVNGQAQTNGQGQRHVAIGPEGECEWCGAMDAPPNLPASIVIAPAGEPGEPLVISGTVFNEDGKTPAEGILLYIYHTNTAGIYAKRTPDSGRPQWRHGYLRGWLRTGKDGRYQFRTIKPGGYPNRPEAPAHIHFTVSGKDYPEYPGGFLFADDPRVTPKERAVQESQKGRGSILTLTRDASGVLHGSYDITLQRFPG